MIPPETLRNASAAALGDIKIALTVHGHGKWTILYSGLRRRAAIARGDEAPAAGYRADVIPEAFTIRTNPATWSAM